MRCLFSIENNTGIKWCTTVIGASVIAMVAAATRADGVNSGGGFCEILLLTVLGGILQIGYSMLLCHICHKWLHRHDGQGQAQND